MVGEPLCGLDGGQVLDEFVTPHLEAEDGPPEAFRSRPQATASSTMRSMPATVPMAATSRSPWKLVMMWAKPWFSSPRR